MVLESLIVSACFYGNQNACQSGLSEYAKYYKLDKQAEIIGENIKKKYPAVHFVGVVAGGAVQKKANFLIYGPFWYQGDFTDNNNIKNMVLIKWGF